MIVNRLLSDQMFNSHPLSLQNRHYISMLRQSNKDKVHKDSWYSEGKWKGSNDGAWSAKSWWGSGDKWGDKSSGSGSGSSSWQGGRLSYLLPCAPCVFACVLAIASAMCLFPVLHAKVAAL